MLKVIRYIPDLVRLLFGLMLDGRVWWGAKVIFILGLLYLIVPTDLVADFIPFAGMVDDLVVFLLCCYLFLVLVPRDVMDEHILRVRERNQH